MTGPEHFAEAARLLAEAGTDAGFGAGHEERAWAAALVARAAIHAQLATAAAVAMSGGMNSVESAAWADVAGTRLSD